MKEESITDIFSPMLHGWEHKLEVTIFALSQILRRLMQMKLWKFVGEWKNDALGAQNSYQHIKDIDIKTYQ